MLSTELSVAPPGTPGPARRRRWIRVAWVVAGLASLAGLVAVAALPWEWSFIEDTGGREILQELSGLCFVGLGLLARRRQAPRIAAFLVAAWFKAPFAWLLVGYGTVLLLRRGTRWWGALCVALGAGTLVAAVRFARTGSYTAGFGLDAGRVADAAQTAAVQFAPLGVVLVAGALALRVRVPRWPWQGDPTGPALLLGGLGYLANLLPWQTGVHYASPYLYLIGAGTVLTLAPGARPARGTCTATRPPRRACATACWRCPTGRWWGTTGRRRGTGSTRSSDTTARTPVPGSRSSPTASRTRGWTTTSGSATTAPVPPPCAAVR